MKHSPANPDDVFERLAQRYDEWFDHHPDMFESELLALRQAVPEQGSGIEIGVGSGRFAAALRISTGVEPAVSMGRIAANRGIRVIEAVAEKLPLEDNSFDFAMMVTAICFFSDLNAALLETRRILKPGGLLIAAIIDKDSPLGQRYSQARENNNFYRGAHFYSVSTLTEIMWKVGFRDFQYWQTLFEAKSAGVQQPQEGFGKGSFIVIKAVSQP